MMDISLRKPYKPKHQKEKQSSGDIHRFRNLRVLVVVMVIMGGCAGYCIGRLGGSNLES